MGFDRLIRNENLKAAGAGAAVGVVGAALADRFINTGGDQATDTNDGRIGRSGENGSTDGENATADTKGDSEGMSWWVILSIVVLVAGLLLAGAAVYSSSSCQVKMKNKNRTTKSAVS